MQLAKTKKHIRFSISVRIAFLFCSTFALGLAIAFLVTYFELTYSLERSSREILSSKLEEAKTVLTTDGVLGLKRFLSIEKNRILNAPYLIRVVNKDGEVLFLKPSIQEKNFDFENFFKKFVNPSALAGWHSIQAIDDEDKFNLLTEQVEKNEYLQVGRSSEERESLLEEILLNFAIIEVILVFISAFFGIWYAQKSLKPLRNMLKTIKIIESGNLSQRVQVTESKDELYELGETFNHMITRIEKSIVVMTDSLDNVAHEIRTPLTRIRAIAEDALISKKPPELQNALEDCAESATHIAELVDQLLTISEAEGGGMKLHLESCDIKLLLQEIAEIYEFIALEKHITINIHIQETQLNWVVDRRRIKQAVANLLDNAIKFSEEHTCVSLAANIENKELVLSVKDSGPGISDEDISRIWDRLFRSDKSRGTPGSGIGLSLVRSIVLANGGRYCATRNPDRGMTFKIYLP